MASTTFTNGVTLSDAGWFNDVDLVTYDGLTTQILVGGGAGSVAVWTAATGTGAPVRAGSPTFTGTAVFEAATFGGGYGATGVTISAAGNIQANGTLTVDGASALHGNITLAPANNTGIRYAGGDTGQVALYGADTLSATFGANGITLAPATTLSSTLAVTGNTTLASVDIGGGYGSTGVTISATGNIQANGTLTVDGASTLTGLTSTVAAGIVGTFNRTGGNGQVLSIQQAGTAVGGVYTNANGDLAIYSVSGGLASNKLALGTTGGTIAAHLLSNGNGDVVLSAIPGGVQSNQLGLGVSGGTIIEYVTATGILAGADNTLTCGGASNRWSVVYAGTGAINTSDAREKTEVRPFTAAEIAAAKQLSAEIGVFRFLDAVAKKGDAARLHVGLTVQRAIEVMQSHGLDPMAYGFICYDEWPDVFVEHPAIEAVEHQPAVPPTYREVLTVDGEALQILVDSGRPEVRAVEAKEAWTEQTAVAGNRYGFRPDELLLFIARVSQTDIAAIKAALAANGITVQ